MKVLYFGSYYPDYSRNRINIKGLQKNNVEVIECSNYSAQIWSKFLELMRNYKSDYNAMIIGFPGNYYVPFGKLLTKLNKKPLIFDAFLSIFDTNVFDRKLVKEGSLKAKYYFWLDRLACVLSDTVLLDTNEHINYFCREFAIEKKKFKRIFVGADDEVFYPREIEKKNDVFTVEFHGGFIPLQGVDFIIRAAKILEDFKDIRFEIIGSGQTYNDVMSLSRELKLKNVVFRGWVKYEHLPYHIAKADVGLGIFGKTKKANRVIPNKAFQVLAMKKPLVTGDSKAVREAHLINKKNAMLVEMANPRKIANTILELKEDEKLREKIAKNGFELFKKNFTLAAIGKELKKTIQEAQLR